MTGAELYLSKMGEALRTQNNRGTADPLFVVEKRRRDHGYQIGYADGYEWLDAENDYESADDDKAAELDRDEEEGDDTSAWVKTGYRDRWEFVTACLTEVGCKNYITANGHNLGETRIYAHSA